MSRIVEEVSRKGTEYKVATENRTETVNLKTVENSRDFGEDVTEIDLHNGHIIDGVYMWRNYLQLTIGDKIFNFKLDPSIKINR